MTHFRSVPEPPDASNEPAGIVDWGAIRERVGFALGAVRRRPFVSALCFLSIAALGPLSLEVMPRTWRVEATFTASRTPVVSTLAYPVLQRAFEAEDPAQAAHDAILRQDNLEALIAETGLLERWMAARSPIRRLRDRVEAVLTGRERTQAERIDALVERLEKRLAITVPGAAPGAPHAAPRDRVVLAVEWYDPETAKLLVETAARRFFDAQRARERALVEDALGALEGHAAAVRGELEQRVKKVHALEVQLVRGRPELARSDRAQRGRVPEEAAVAGLRAVLEARRLAATEVDRVREQRREGAREELGRLRAIYSEQHPAVQREKKLVESLAAPSPQAAGLRADVALLEQELEQASSKVARLVDAENPTLEYERTELRVLLAQYATVRDRIDGARVEMQASQAAFDHRYGFTVPPRLPRRPVGPIAPLAIASALLAGALFALFAATALDVRSGRLLERWQLERNHGVRVLGELRC